MLKPIVHAYGLREETGAQTTGSNGKHEESTQTPYWMIAPSIMTNNSVMRPVKNYSSGGVVEGCLLNNTVQKKEISIFYAWFKHQTDTNTESVIVLHLIIFHILFHVKH